MITQILFAIALSAGIAEITTNDQPAIFTHVELIKPGPTNVYHRFTMSCGFDWGYWLWGEVDTVTAECVDEDWIRCDVDPDLPHDPALFPTRPITGTDAHGEFRIEVIQCVSAPYRVPMFSGGFE